MLQEEKYQNGYRKVYKIRATGEDGLNIIVSIPREVIERQARIKGITIEEFIATHQAVAAYNSFEGVHYTFEPKVQNGKTTETNS